MAEISHRTQSSEAKGQVIRWRDRLYHEPSDIEIERAILRALKYENPRRIHPKAFVGYGHLLIKGLRKHTYERVTKVLQTLYPENLLNLEYVHSSNFVGRNYLDTSNRHPLGRYIAKCLANSFAQQINQAFRQLGLSMTENSTRLVAWAYGTKSWYTPSDPTDGFDDCVYHPDNQVRVISRTFMPPVLIYVVSWTELRHTRDKVMTLVHHNLGVTSVVIISIDQVRQRNLEHHEPSINNPGQHTDLPSTPCFTNNTVRHGDRISVTVLRVVNQEDSRYSTWPIQDVEIFPTPTNKKLKATFEDLTLLPWSSSSREPEFCLSFGELTASCRRLCSPS